MKLVGNVLQVLGGCLIFAGLFWIKGPAIMPIEYGYGLAVALIGLAIFFVGIRIFKRATTHPSKMTVNE